MPRRIASTRILALCTDGGRQIIIDRRGFWQVDLVWRGR
jgi:hypothetical protein